MSGRIVGIALAHLTDDRLEPEDRAGHTGGHQQR